MAEIFGIVSGVLGLLPLCHDGLGMLIDVFDASKTFPLAVGRLELQRDKFDEWREIWTSDDGEEDIKFEAYAKSNPVFAKRVLRQLALMSQVLFDARGLEEFYGIKSDRANRDSKDLSQFRLKSGAELTIETQGSFLERCRLNLNFLKRTHFTLFKKDTLSHTLITHLKEHTSHLCTYGPPSTLSKLRKGELELVKELNLQELRRLAEAASYEAKHEDGTEKARYHELSLASQFSAVVRFERPHAAFKFSMRDFRVDESYILSSTPASTMALLFDYPVKKEHRVVLIEWIDPPHPNAASFSEIERETRIKTLMLATPKPAQLLLPTCYGMVEDSYARRFGLVLAPPTHIRSGLPSILPAGAISQKRMPVSLRELMDKRHPACVGMLELGTRFALARRVVGAVWGWFCVGWIHKNIRANTLLFFPAKSKTSPGPTPSFPQPLDYTEPLFTGLSSARLDEIYDPEPPYHGGNQLVLTHNPALHPLHPVNQHQHGVQHVYLPHHGGSNVVVDYYMHPRKNEGSSRGVDVYALGVLLLEIGLWKNMDGVVDLRTLFEEEGVGEEGWERVRREFLSLTGRLDGLMGSIYATVVRKCLSVKVRDRNEEEGRELSEFFKEILITLDKCCA